MSSDQFRDGYETGLKRAIEVVKNFQGESILIEMQRLLEESYKPTKLPS